MTAIYSSYMLMFVPSFIRIERGLDGVHYFILNKMPVFALKSVNTNVSLFAAKNELLCQQAVITAMQTSHTSMSVPSFVRIERGSNGGS